MTTEATIGIAAFLFFAYKFWNVNRPLSIILIVIPLAATLFLKL